MQLCSGLQPFPSRRVFLLALSALMGLGAVALLLAAAPARPVQAAAAPLAPAGCSNDSFEPNNVYTQATPLEFGAVINNLAICDIPVSNEEDWYQIDLASGQRVQIFLHFTHANGDLDMALYESDGTTSVAFSTGSVDNEKIDYTPAASGTYYLLVVGFGTAQNIYDLSLTGGCFARAVSEFFSVDAEAVRLAVAEAAPGSTVKIAGYCPGTIAEGGGTQTVLVTKTLTLAGGYQPGDWDSTILTAPTTLDAMHSGAVVSSSAAVTLTNFTVWFGLNQNGGGLYSTAETVLDHMIFFSNVATAAGGGAYIEASATVTNSGFYNNEALSNAGGGLFALQATVSGGSINSNRALLSGGGLYAPFGFNLSGTFFAGNQAASGGGAYSAFFSTIQNGSFVLNKALAGDGGGLNVEDLELSGTSFTGNSATGYGGALAATGEIHLVDATFTNNMAAFGGGVGTQAPATVEGVTFQSNQAGTGGGMFAGDSMVISATEFSNNRATVHGGGLAQSYELPLTRQHDLAFGDPGRLVNVLFVNNTAGNGRDLSLAAPLTNTILHSTFIFNGQPVAASVSISAGSLTLRNSLFNGAPAALKQTGGSLDEDYNLFFGGGGTVASYLNGAIASGGHSFVADPLLSDFHLSFLSPARDRALDLAVPVDFDGDPRPLGPLPDIGYDEIKYWRLVLPALLR